MFFKSYLNHLGHLLVVLLCLAMIACIPKFGEDPPEPLEQKIAGVDCLGGSFVAMENYFQGTAQDSDILSSFLCMDTVLDKFVRLVRGKVKGRYETQELADFIESQFLNSTEGMNGKKISAKLQLEVMKVKRIFLGGSLDHLTVEEIRQLRSLLSQVGQLLVRLNPAMKVLSMNWSPYRDWSYFQTSDHFEKSSLELQSFIENFTSLIIRHDATYELKDLKDLFIEFDRFYGKNWSFVSQIENYTPVAGKLKKALNGGDEKIIQPREWRSVLLLVGRGYVQYLRYFYFLKDGADAEFGLSTRLPYFARTFEDLLSMLGQLIEIKPTSTLTIGELKEFGDALSQAWPEFRMSDEFLRQFMRLKTLIFGGSDSSWTSQDFLNGQSKVMLVQKLIERLLPYYQIYGMDWDSKKESYPDALTHLSKAETELVAALPQLSALFERDLNLDEILAFVREFEKIYDPKRARNDLISDSIAQFLPLFKQIKSRMFGDQGGVIKKVQWTNIGFVIGKGYGQYLHFYYFLEPIDFQSPDFSKRLSDFLRSFFPFGKSLIGIFPRKEIRARDFQAILSEVKKAGFFDSLSTQTLDRFVDLVLNRLLMDPEARLNKQWKQDVLNDRRWDVLVSEVERWLLPEVYFSSEVSAQRSVELERLKRNIERRIRTLSANSPERGGLQESLRFLSHEFVLQTDSKGRVVIDAQRRQDRIHLASLSRMNLSRTLARVLMRSYVEDLRRIQNYTGFEKTEIERAVDDVKPLLRGFGFQTEISPTFVSSRFFEANIFLPHANGDQILSYEETAELATMILSGLQVSSEFRTEFDRSCGTKGLPGPAKVDYQCILDESYRHIPKIQNELPQFVNYRNQVSGEEFGKFFYDVLRGVSGPPDTQLKSRLEDIALIPHLIQYIELTYWRFDHNRNELIEYEEAQRAFPLFEGLLLDLSSDYIEQGLLSRDQMFALFCYLLNYRKIPDEKTYLTTWLWWKLNPSKWRELTVSRTEIAAILAMIREMINKQTYGATPIVQ